MNELRKKLKSLKVTVFGCDDGNPCIISSSVLESSVNELEKIADDYALKFVDWLTNEKSVYAVLYGNQEERFATFDKDYTINELLQYFKDNVYKKTQTK